MKEWQKGYELDYLVEKTKKFDHYNSFSCSPFSEVKKNNIPEYLVDDTFRDLSDCVFVERVAKVSSPIKMYQDIIIGHKQVGDTIIEKISLQNSKKSDSFIEYIQKIDTGVWIETWAEDLLTNEMIQNLTGVEYVGAKITTFAEIKHYWFKEPSNILFGRDHVKVPEYELYNLEKLNIDSNKILPLVESIKSKIDKLPQFINHYSNYNKGKSWSAISLRGYRPEPTFMTKPSEMNKKWQEENKDVQFEMQDTTLYQDFEEVRELVNMLNSDEVHRIRFMKLTKGDGELERHTDLVDDDSGIADGKLMRIHFPIVTNPKVEFTSWRVDGSPKKEHMGFGEAWFLDTRKPHRAINAGDEDRIHLVVDVLASENVRSLL